MSLTWQKLCEECGGEGLIRSQTMGVGTGHAPGCIGPDGPGNRCGFTCPVPVPEPVDTLEICPNCEGERVTPSSCVYCGGKPNGADISGRPICDEC